MGSQFVTDEVFEARLADINKKIKEGHKKIEEAMVAHQELSQTVDKKFEDQGAKLDVVLSYLKMNVQREGKDVVVQNTGIESSLTHKDPKFCIHIEETIGFQQANNDPLEVTDVLGTKKTKDTYLNPRYKHDAS